MKAFASFSYREALKSSFNRVVDNFSTYGYLGLVWVGITIVLYGSITGLLFMLSLPLYNTSLITSAVTGQTYNFPIFSPFLLFPHYIYGFLVGPYVHFQYLNLAMDLQNGKEISVKRAFSYGIGTFFRYLLTRFVRGLKIVLGFLLFLFPGIYLGLKNYFAGYSILENPATSFSEDTGICHKLTNHVKWKLFLVGWLKVTYAMLPWGIALFMFPPLMFANVITGPFGALIDVDVYRQLKKARMS